MWSSIQRFQEDETTARGMRIPRYASAFTVVLFVFVFAAVKHFSRESAHEHKAGSAGAFLTEIEARRLFFDELPPTTTKEFKKEVEHFHGYHQSVICKEYHGVDHPSMKGCCLASCGGYCGSADCYLGPGGAPGCCETQLPQNKWCSHTQMAPCRINATHLTHSFSDEKCRPYGGIDTRDKTACCHPQCGEFCGTDSDFCADGPGGMSACCKDFFTRTCGLQSGGETGLGAPCKIEELTTTLPSRLEPPMLSYPGVPGGIKTGVLVHIKPQIVYGQGATYSIQPALPSGLVFFPASGVIQGTVAKDAQSLTQRYVVTATNAAGVGHAFVVLSIVGQEIEASSYTTTTFNIDFFNAAIKKAFTETTTTAVKATGTTTTITIGSKTTPSDIKTTTTSTTTTTTIPSTTTRKPTTTTTTRASRTLRRTTFLWTTTTRWIPTTTTTTTTATTTTVSLSIIGKVIQGGDWEEPQQIKNDDTTTTTTTTSTSTTTTITTTTSTTTTTTTTTSTSTTTTTTTTSTTTKTHKRTEITGVEAVSDAVRKIKPTSTTTSTTTASMTQEGIGILTYQKAQRREAGEIIEKFTPHFTGHVQRFEISPKLPRSFVFNPMSGIIEGVISNAGRCHARVQYSVTAFNSAGESTAEVELLAANESLSAPTALRYPGVHDYEPGEKVIFFPNYQGGKPTMYAVTPLLPDDFKLNPKSGEIQGRVRAGQQSFTVEARNICGSASTVITFAVGNAPKNLSYSVPLLFLSYQSFSLSPKFPGSGNAKSVTFAVEPALPTGVTLDPSTGTIEGQLGQISMEHFTAYVITARNSYGESRFIIKLPGKLVFAYNGVPEQFFVGDVVKLEPTYNGARPAKFSITPALPEGLTIDPNTGEIAGAINARISGEMQNYDVTVATEDSLTGKKSKASTHFGINVPVVGAAAAAAGNSWATPVYLVISLLILAAVLYLIQLLRKSKDPEAGSYVKLIAAMEDNVDSKDSVQRLPLVFQTRTGLQTVYATHKPLGLVYQKSRLPIKITNVTESHGKDVGVQVGWVLKSINNRELSGFGNFEDIYHIMHEEMCKLPGGVALTWNIGNGRERTVWAMKKPLGIVFDKSLPITITTETPGHGKDVGVQVGWVLKSINNRELSGFGNFEDIYHIMHEEMCKLPGGVALTWDIGNRRERTVWAMKKPLGIVFDKSLPITITTETLGHGYDIGIRKGWILKRVNYIDLTRKSTFEEADAVLLEEIDKMLDPQYITSHPQGFLP